MSSSSPSAKNAVWKAVLAEYPTLQAVFDSAPLAQFPIHEDKFPAEMFCMLPGDYRPLRIQSLVYSPPEPTKQQQAAIVNLASVVSDFENDRVIHSCQLVGEILSCDATGSNFWMRLDPFADNVVLSFETVTFSQQNLARNTLGFSFFEEIPNMPAMFCPTAILHAVAMAAHSMKTCRKWSWRPRMSFVCLDPIRLISAANAQEQMRMVSDGELGLCTIYVSEDLNILTHQGQYDEKRARYLLPWQTFYNPNEIVQTQSLLPTSFIKTCPGTRVELLAPLFEHFKTNENGSLLLTDCATAIRSKNGVAWHLTCVEPESYTMPISIPSSFSASSAENCTWLEQRQALERDELDCRGSYQPSWSCHYSMLMLKDFLEDNTVWTESEYQSYLQSPTYAQFLFLSFMLQTNDYRQKFNMIDASSVQLFVQNLIDVVQKGRLTHDKIKALQKALSVDLQNSLYLQFILGNLLLFSSRPNDIRQVRKRFLENTSIPPQMKVFYNDDATTTNLQLCPMFYAYAPEGLSTLVYKPSLEFVYEQTNDAFSYLDSTVLQIQTTLGKGLYGAAYVVGLKNQDNSNQQLLMVLKDQAVSTKADHMRTVIHLDQANKAAFVRAEVLEAFALIMLEQYGSYPRDPNIHVPRLISAFPCCAKSDGTARFHMLMEFVPNTIPLHIWIRKLFVNIVEVKNGDNQDPDAIPPAVELEYMKCMQMIQVVRSRLAAYDRFLYSQFQFQTSDRHDANVLVVPTANPFTMPLYLIDFGRCSFNVPREQLAQAVLFDSVCYDNHVFFSSSWNRLNAQAYDVGSGIVSCIKKS